MITYKKFAWAYLTAAGGSPEAGKMALSDLAIALVVHDRAPQNIVTQWEIDEESLVKASVQELQDACLWLRQQIEENTDLEREVVEAYSALHSYIVAGLNSCLFKDMVLPSEWSETIKIARKQLP